MIQLKTLNNNKKPAIDTPNFFIRETMMLNPTEPIERVINFRMMMKSFDEKGLNE